MRIDYINGLNKSASELLLEIDAAIVAYEKGILKLKAFRPLIEHLAADDDIDPQQVEIIKAIAAKHAPGADGERRIDFSGGRQPRPAAGQGS